MVSFGSNAQIIGDMATAQQIARAVSGGSLTPPTGDRIAAARRGIGAARAPKPPANPSSGSMTTQAGTPGLDFPAAPPAPSTSPPTPGFAPGQPQSQPSAPPPAPPQDFAPTMGLGISGTSTTPGTSGPLGSVGSRVDAMLRSDSPLMVQAATRGRQEAGRRGLANSSMAIGAAQLAMLDAATPIASQESQEATQRDIAAANNASSERISQANIASAEKIAQLQIEARTKEAQAEADLRLTLADIDKNTQLTLAEKRVEADKALAEFNAAKETRLAEYDAMVRTSLAEKDIASREGLATQQMTLQERLAAEETALRRDLSQSSISSQEKLAADEAALRTTLSQQQIDANRSIAELDTQARRDVSLAQLASSDRQAITTALTQLSGDFSTALSNTLANNKIPAAERSRIQEGLRAQYQAQMNDVLAMYGVSLGGSAA